MKSTMPSELCQNKNEGKIDNPQTHTQDCSLFWLRRDTYKAEVINEKQKIQHCHNSAYSTVITVRTALL